MKKFNAQSKADLITLINSIWAQIETTKKQLATANSQITMAQNDLSRLKAFANTLEQCDEIPPPSPIIGVNMGKEYDQVAGKHPIIQYIKNVRVFMLLEDVYNGKYPSHNDPHYNPSNLDDWNYSMTGYRNRLRQMKEQGFDVRISLEAIFEKEQNGNKILRTRKFPNKSFSRDEWGGTERAIRENAKKLAKAIHAMYGEYISRIEFTNEAWGEPGFEATKWVIRGLYEGLQEVGSNLKLSMGAYQAYKPDNRFNCGECDYPNGDFIGHVFEPWMANFIDELTIHPYSFSLNTIDLTQPPMNNENSEFKYLYDMVKWRDENYPSMKLSITEIGWNSVDVGEDNQAMYLKQVIAEAKRLNLYAVYLYEAVDSPTDPLFSTCGLYTTDSVARVPRRAKKFLLEMAQQSAARAQVLAASIV